MIWVHVSRGEEVERKMFNSYEAAFAEAQRLLEQGLVVRLRGRGGALGTGSAKTKLNPEVKP